MICISKSTLKELNTTQSTLIKMNLGLSKYARSSALLDTVRIESVKQLYYKFKLLFIKPFTNTLLEFLDEYYFEKECPSQSFIGPHIENKRPPNTNEIRTCNP